MAGSVNDTELQPDVIFLFDLVGRLVSGKLSIPKFQRPFVWRRQQMLDLLDSVNKQYPIGSLLAWETDLDLASLSNVGPVRLSNSRGLGQRVSYLLDGHQRLSTIAGALVSLSAREAVNEDEDPARWRIYFNARDDSFEHLELDVAPAPYHFAMSSLLDTIDFFAEGDRINGSGDPDARMYIEKAQRVARTFQNYRIPIIEIKETGLTEAVEIFARLNSKGQSMTADQMVSALLYRDGDDLNFDLAEEISKCTKILDSYGFGQLDRTVVLRVLLGAVGEDIYKTDWTQIAQVRRGALLKQLKEVLPSVRSGLELAAKFLRDDVGVVAGRLLPYAGQMVVLASFFTAQQNASTAQLDLLRRWFWVTSFTEWFGGANPSRVNDLVRDVIDSVALNQDDPSFSQFDLSAPATPLPASFDLRSARTRSLLLALFSLEPRDRSGVPIDNLGLMLDTHGSSLMGYICTTGVSDRRLARHPANRIVRDDLTDRRQAKSWILDLEDPATEVLGSLALPLDSKELLKAGGSDEFLSARVALLGDMENEFMVARGVVLPGSAMEAFNAPQVDSVGHYSDDE